MILRWGIHSCAFSSVMCSCYYLLCMIIGQWLWICTLSIKPSFAPPFMSFRFNVNNTEEQTRLNRSTFHQLYLWLPTWHPWSAELACNHHSTQTPPCSAQGARLHTKWWLLPAGSPALGLCREEQQTQHMSIMFKLDVQGGYIQHTHSNIMYTHTRQCKLSHYIPNTFAVKKMSFTVW